MVQEQLPQRLIQSALNHAARDGFTWGWRLASDAAPVTVRLDPYSGTSPPFYLVTVGRPGESFASLTRPEVGAHGVVRRVLSGGEAERMLKIDPATIPRDVQEADRRTRERLGSGECPELLQRDLSRLWVAQGRSDHEDLELWAVREACREVLFYPRLAPTNDLADLVVRPHDFPAARDWSTPEQRAELAARLKEGRDALHDYYLPGEALRLDYVLEREARDVTHRHDRTIDPLLERLTARTKAFDPALDQQHIEATYREALSSASLAHSDRGAELMFLRALPTKIRMAFNHGDPALLRDAGRIAREHAGPRDARLVELRHQTGPRRTAAVADRGRQALDQI